MGTKNEPGKFDCYKNAEPDEPMFILLARDRTAPDLVDLWADAREGDDEDADKIAEARQCAENMRQWRRENRPTDQIEIVCDQCSRTIFVDPTENEGFGVTCPKCGFTTQIPE